VGEDILVLAWILLVVGSLIAGALLVGLLVAPRPMVPVVLFFALAGILVSVSGLVALALTESRVDLALATALIGFLLLALSYSVTAILLQRLFGRPAQVAPDVSPTEPRSCAAVILAAHVEPKTYQPSTVTATLREYDATNVPLPSSTARPMLYAAERARYHAAGSSSPALGTLEGLVGRIEGALAHDARFAGGVHVACYTCEPRLDSVVSRVAAEGIREIVVLGLAVAQSLRADAARAAVDALRPASHGVYVSYAAPLWGASCLTDRVAERIVTAMGDRPRDRVGVVLVGHGQPAEWHAGHPTWTEQETFFQQRVNVQLQEAGLPPQNIRLAWLDWSEPDVTEAVRHLAALDNDLVIVVPSVMPVETLGTFEDLRQAVHFARVAESVETVILGAWGEDPVVVEELAKRARAVMDERDTLES
jgi:protoheme ferro-lyase